MNSEQPPTPTSINPSIPSTESEQIISTIPNTLNFPGNVAADNNGNASRNYVFTDWEPTRQWSDYNWEVLGARYAVGQFEVAPTTGQRHFQGYVELVKPTRYVALKRIWPGPQRGANVWFGCRMGTATQARRYCMKDETRAPSTESNPSGPFEFGTFVDNGHGGRKRKRDPHIDDAELVKKLMLEGKTRFDIIMLYPHFADRYRSLFDHMELHIAGLKQRETTSRPRCKVVAIQGQAGTGKSSTIRKLVEELNMDLYTMPIGNSGFCDDYAEEDVLMVEELESKTLEFERFKSIADCTHTKMRRKHKAALPFNSKLLVMITNHSFKDIWPTLKTNTEDLDAARRRVDMWCKYTKALPPYTGFSAIRFRFQNVEDPTEPIIEWLGLSFPLVGNMTFVKCIGKCFLAGLGKSSVADVRDWVAMTRFILRLSMASYGQLCEQARLAIRMTPSAIKVLQSNYDITEDFHRKYEAYSNGVYSKDYDLLVRSDVTVDVMEMSAHNVRTYTPHCPETMYSSHWKKLDALAFVGDLSHAALMSSFFVSLFSLSIELFKNICITLKPSIDQVHPVNRVGNRKWLIRACDFLTKDLLL